ncbi:hypothetical protein [Leucobacter sp. USHLN153]|uniref:hypothetical protein n=1 Tax=Leucobacter sp. USHLN153 TaxID=3081268 RepID=UPI0030180F70
MNSAIDPYHAAARIESQGYSDAAAKRLGWNTVFELASAMWELREPQQTAQQSRGTSDLLVNALWRTIVLVAGVLISLACLSPGASPAQVFVTGATGWVCSQAVSAGIWRAIVRGHHASAALAVWTAPALLAIVAIVSLAIGQTAPIWWALWAVSASVLVILRLRPLLVIAAAAGAALTTVAATLVSPEAGRIVGVAVAIAATIAAAVVLNQEFGSHTLATARRLVTPDMVAAAVLGAMQALGQVGVLAVLLLMTGEQAFAAIAVAGLVAGAISDPLLELKRSAVHRIATTVVSATAARRATAIAGALGTCAIVVIAAGVAVLSRAFFAPEEALWHVVAATCVVATVTSGTGVLLRAGSAAGATAFALGAALLCAAVGLMPLTGVEITVLATVASLAALTLAFTLALSARMMSRPAAW